MPEGHGLLLHVLNQDPLRIRQRTLIREQEQPLLLFQQPSVQRTECFCGCRGNQGRLRMPSSEHYLGISDSNDSIIKVERIWATPLIIFLLTFFLLRTTFLPATRLSLLHWLFLLAGNSTFRTFAGTCIVFGVLAANRQTHTMSAAAVAANFN